MITILKYIAHVSSVARDVNTASISQQTGARDTSRHRVAVATTSGAFETYAKAREPGAGTHIDEGFPRDCGEIVGYERA